MHTPPPQTPGRTSQTGRLAQPLQLPALTSKDITGLQIFLAVFSVFRAGDYLFSIHAAVSFAELAFPLWVWAVSCLVVAWCILVGTAARSHFLVWVGHAIGAVAYLGLSLGALMQSIVTTRDGPVLAAIETPLWIIALGAFVASPIVAAALSARIGRSVGRASAWACVATTAACAIVAFSPIIALDGARGVGPILTVMCIHGWLAARMGPRPIGDPRESA